MFCHNILMKYELDIRYSGLGIRQMLGSLRYARVFRNIFRVQIKYQKMIQCSFPFLDLIWQFVPCLFFQMEQKFISHKIQWFWFFICHFSFERFIFTFSLSHFLFDLQFKFFFHLCVCSQWKLSLILGKCDPVIIFFNFIMSSTFIVEVFVFFFFIHRSLLTVL